MSKQSILVTALHIFAKFGIKGVTMSQIASVARVSKKTLYSYFGSKEELLCACVRHDSEHVAEMLREVDEQAKNSVDAILQLSAKVHHYRASYCPAFYKDIQQFDEANGILNGFYGRIQSRLVTYFDHGVKRGFFQSHVNYELIGYLLMEQMFLQSRVKMTHRSTMFYTFLRGLCTQVGVRMLDELSVLEEEKYMYA